MLVFLELPKDWQPKIFWALIFSHYFEFWGKEEQTAHVLRKDGTRDVSAVNQCVRFITEREK